MPFFWDTRPRQWKFGHLKLMTLCCLEISFRPTAYPMARCHNPEEWNTNLTVLSVSYLLLFYLVGTNSKNIFLITDVPTSFLSHFLTNEVQVRFQVSLCVIFAMQVVSGGGFSPLIINLP